MTALAFLFGIWILLGLFIASYWPAWLLPFVVAAAGLAVLAIIIHSEALFDAVFKPKAPTPPNLPPESQKTFAPPEIVRRLAFEPIEQYVKEEPWHSLFQEVVADLVDGEKVWDHSLDEQARAIAAALTPLAIVVPRNPQPSPLQTRVASYLLDPISIVQGIVDVILHRKYGEVPPDTHPDARENFQTNCLATPHMRVFPRVWSGEFVTNKIKWMGERSESTTYKYLPVTGPHPEKYLDGTPFARILNHPVPLSFPPETRFEHQWVMAPTGHGKTSAFQRQLEMDLAAMERGECSVIVIDTKGSQEDLIKHLTHLKVFSDQPNKLVFIDPTDVEHPVALSLFTMGRERISRLSPLERERLNATMADLLSFTFNSLFDTRMTNMQEGLFAFAVSAMAVIPRANIWTLYEFLLPGGEKPHLEHLARLERADQAFLEHQFNSEQYRERRQEVSRRLYELLRNRTFAPMFSATESKLDLFAEMNGAKCIVINAEKSLLRQGTEIYARFFIALIASAIAERSATLPPNQRLPCYVYLDEFGDYGKTADQRINDCFRQARSAKVGFIVGHQGLADLAPETVAALLTNTATKMAGNVTHSDAVRLAHDMGDCEADFIKRCAKLEFATFIKGVTPSAVRVTFQPGALAALPHMTPSEFKHVRADMRRRYSIAVQPEPKPERESDEGPRATTEPPWAEAMKKKPEPTRGEGFTMNDTRTSSNADTTSHEFRPQDPPPSSKKDRKRPKKRRGPLVGDVDTSA